MTSNVGPSDRIARIVVALGLAIIIYAGVLRDTTAIITGVVAAYLLVTGLVARCVIYRLIGVDTSIHAQPYSTTDDRAGL